MGRELLVKKLKSRGILSLVAGILVAIFSLFMAIIMFEEVVIAGLIFLVLTAVGVGLAIHGFDLTKGENSKFAKKTPNILELADDIYENKVYEDNFITISNKAIATKKDISSVTDLEDVLAIYEHIQRTNGIVTSHIVKLELRNGRTMVINVYARKRDTKDNLVLIISNYCPNAMVGYTGEMLDYLKKERKAYKESLTNK